PKEPRVTATTHERAALEATYLPIGQMLQLDRVCGVDGERIVCEMDIHPGHWVFPMHFPGDPIFPGSLLVEAAGQAVALWGWEAGLRGRPRMAKVSAEFESPVLVSDHTVRLEAAVRRRRNICVGTVTVSVGERKVATITPVIVVLENGSLPQPEAPAPSPGP
ncbi:MAG: 3-hydroxyacyl-ACP dehydratase FabZ family protein, partial [Acidimicrobiales bacterium]